MSCTRPAAVVAAKTSVSYNPRALVGPWTTLRRPVLLNRFCRPYCGAVARAGRARDGVAHGAAVLLHSPDFLRQAGWPRPRRLATRCLPLTRCGFQRDRRRLRGSKPSLQRQACAWTPPRLCLASRPRAATRRTRLRGLWTNCRGTRFAWCGPETHEAPGPYDADAREGSPCAHGSQVAAPLPPESRSSVREALLPVLLPSGEELDDLAPAKPQTTTRPYVRRPQGCQVPGCDAGGASLSGYQLRARCAPLPCAALAGTDTRLQPVWAAHACAGVAHPRRLAAFLPGACYAATRMRRELNTRACVAEMSRLTRPDQF